MNLQRGGSGDAVTVRRLRDLATRVVESPGLLGQVRLVAVDGRAGSGKTTFSRGLVAALREVGAATEEIHTDDLLPGWGSIVSFWPRLEQRILTPLRTGQPATYFVYDWLAGRFSTTPVEVPVPDVLVVEGVAAAGACGRDRTTLAVCVVARRSLRLERGLARDGESLRHQWLCWMEQEDSYFAGPMSEARTDDESVAAIEACGAFDLVVDGAPRIGHDRAREYVVAGSDLWRVET